MGYETTAREVYWRAREVYWRDHLNVLWKYYVQRSFFGQLWAWIANTP